MQISHMTHPSILIYLGLELLFHATLCLGHARSTSTAGFIPEVQTVSQLPFPKVPLPPSTTSVKCKCLPVTSDSAVPVENDGTFVPSIQSRSDEIDPGDLSAHSPYHREIEIQIFKSDSDLTKSEKEQGDSPNVFEPESTKTFKAFRTAQLVEEPPTEEFLLLGKSYSPFIGPRKKRRKRDALKPNKKVFYVYSVKYNSTNEDGGGVTEKSKEFVSTPNLFSTFMHHTSTSTPNLDPALPLIHPDSHSSFYQRSIDVENNDLGEPQQTIIEKPKEIKPPSPTAQSSLSLEQAMAQAWLDYGPKSVPPPQLNFGPPIPQSEFLSPPQTSVLLPQLPVFSHQFQRKGDLLTSPWDDRIIQNPVSVFDRESLQPGFFSPLLEGYIDFEVNHHEGADLLRKILFAFIIGTLIAGWIALGVALGVFPLHLLFVNEHEKTRANSDLMKRVVGGSDLETLGQNVMLALDLDWLKTLEDRVKKDTRGHFIHTVAKCCVIPTEEKVNCTIVRKDNATGKVEGGPVYCGSDLIYNIQFGVDEDDVEG